MKATLVLFMVVTALMAMADESDLPCDADKEQARATLELSKHVKELEAKLKASKQDYTEYECNEIIRSAEKEYDQLVGIAQTHYRNYLEDFLESATKDHPEVKAMKKLSEYFRKGDGLKLMLKNAAGKKSQFELENHLASSYKLLRKTISENPGAEKELPTTGHDCADHYYAKNNPQKVLDTLISKRPRLTIALNICSERYYDGYPHPQNQKIITFDTSDGKALAFFCKQSFTTTRDPRPKVQNYRDDIVTSKANCLAYDLLADRPVLGDQKQKEIDGESDSYVEISDTRLELAKASGKIPMSYEDFVKANPKLLAGAPEGFFEKVVPNRCKEMTLNYRYALGASKRKYDLEPKIKKGEK